MEDNAYHYLRTICCSIFKELLSFYNKQPNCKHLVLMFDDQKQSKPEVYFRAVREFSLLQGLCKASIRR